MSSHFNPPPAPHSHFKYSLATGYPVKFEFQIDIFLIKYVPDISWNTFILSNFLLHIWYAKLSLAVSSFAFLPNLAILHHNTSYLFSVVCTPWRQGLCVALGCYSSAYQTGAQTGSTWYTLTEFVIYMMYKFSEYLYQLAYTHLPLAATIFLLFTIGIFTQMYLFKPMNFTPRLPLGKPHNSSCYKFKT